MRRTEQEFKAEILRRSNAYKARRRKRLRNSLLSIGCLAVLVMCIPFLPIGMGGSAMDAAAPESAQMVQDSLTTNGIGMEAPAAGEPQEEAAPEESAAAGFVIEEEILTPNAEDSAVISEYLNGAWNDAAVNCASDYTIEINGMIYLYHSECGTFQDAHFRSLSVSQEDLLVINGILEKYTEQTP